MSMRIARMVGNLQSKCRWFLCEDGIDGKMGFMDSLLGQVAHEIQEDLQSCFRHCDWWFGFCTGGMK